MRNIDCLILTFLFAAGCSDAGRSRGPYIIQPIDTDSSDSDTGTDTETDGTDTGFSEPETKEAAIEHQAPTLSECVRLDEESGDFPSLFAFDGKWYAFFTEGADYQTAATNLRVSGVDRLDFSDPVTLLYGAREVDLVREQNRFLALAARQFYAVLLESADGTEWSEIRNIGPDEPTYLCDGYPPARFFRTSGAIRFLAMGNDYNTGIFGCVSRLFFSENKNGEWTVPVQIGDGDAVFAYQGDERLTIVSTFGVYLSSNGGAGFSELAGGDTTASQVRGTGAAAVGDRLFLVQDYNYANEYVIALLASNDEGATWTEKIVLHRSVEPCFSPVIASDRDFVAVAWMSASSIMVMTSPDRGATWSEPGIFEDPGSGSAISSFSLAAQDSLVGLSLKSDVVHMCLAEAATVQSSSGILR